MGFPGTDVDLRWGGDERADEEEIEFMRHNPYNGPGARFEDRRYGGRDGAERRERHERLRREGRL